jgi:hypothetical protein
MTSLRHGDRSQAVRTLQSQLNRAGISVPIDGDYGDTTEAAVRTYQYSAGLLVDGIAGPDTQAALAGQPPQGHLSHSLLQATAERLNVELATVYAVAEVESHGAGFLPNGKPKILFERHIMYRQLALVRSPSDDAQALQAHAAQLAATYPNLVNPKAGGYAGGSAEYKRYTDAALLDALCAAEAASWGAFQIMGYHWHTLGYTSISDFTQRMACSEAEHFEAFVRFILANPNLHKALKGKKWVAFAQGYNGPAYARNLYDVKLERAYQRYSATLQAPA